MALDPKTKATVEGFNEAILALGVEREITPAEGVVAAQVVLAHYALRNGMTLEELMVNVAANVPGFYESWYKLFHTAKPLIEEVKA